MSKSNLKLKTKLLLLFFIPILVLLTGNIIAMNLLKSEVQKGLSGFDSRLARIEELSRIKLEFSTMIQEWKNTLLRGHNKKDFDKYSQRFIKRSQSMLEDLNKLEQSASAKESATINNIRLGIEQLSQAYQKSMHTNLQPGSFNYIAADAQVQGLDRPVTKEVNELSENFLSEIVEFKTQINEESQSLIYNILFISVFVFVAIAVPFIIIVNKLSGHLTTIIEELTESSDKVSQTSQSLSESSNRLSSATTEQAASLQETAATVDEINAMVDRNATNSAQSAEFTENCNIVVEEGMRTVERMIQTINEVQKSNQEINEQVKRSNQEIDQVVNVIAEIGEKTKVINDIVFQTKLLSFNASVEAARAGEQGKGFAVVAEEVGNLAQMSGQAASEITTMLDSRTQQVSQIVEETRSAVERLMQNGLRKIEEGTHAAQSCGEIFSKITSSFKDINNKVQEISSATNEQSIGVKEVNVAMTQLDQVTQENSALANETNSMGADLEHQSKQLDLLVDRLAAIVGTVQNHSTHNLHEDNTQHSDFHNDDKTIEIPRRKAA